MIIKRKKLKSLRKYNILKWKLYWIFIIYILPYFINILMENQPVNIRTKEVNSFEKE